MVVETVITSSHLAKIGKAAKGAAIGLPPVAGWGWCWKTIWPWLVERATSVQSGEPFKWPSDGSQRLALVGLVVLPVISFLSYFFVQVWKELERDLYKSTADKFRAFWTASFAHFARWHDATSGKLGGVFARKCFTRRYLRELPRLRSLLDVRGLVQMETQHFDLEEIYVELKAASRTSSGRSRETAASSDARGRATIWEHLRLLTPGVGLAIIGAPGSGKTTLLKHLMLMFARNRQSRKKMRRRVPFFIELRKLPRLLERASPSLPDLLEKVLRAEQDLGVLLLSMPRDWLAKVLKSGRGLILWDGLDEVPDAESRKVVSDWIDRQINHTAWRSNLFLVTSRPAGYESVPLQNVLSLEVQPFAWEDTRLFIHRWYLANRMIKSRATTPHRTIRDIASNDAEKLIRRLCDHPGLSALTSNPLLLTMVCLMHELGELPGSRSQLYEEICQVHLERWRRRKDQEGAGPRPWDSWNAAQKLMVLRALAHHLMKRGEHSGSSLMEDSKRISSNIMFQVAKKSLDHIGVSTDRGLRKSFFTDLHEQSGIWLEFERDRWGFAHLSFQEYLCADLWFVEPDTMPKEMAPLFEESWWRETLLLYASKATDLGPIIRAALNLRTRQSVAFLFALDGEAIAIPVDLKPRLDEELYRALSTWEESVFKPAAEAWLLRQQRNYIRLSEGTDLSCWVSQAEYQLFLLDKSNSEYWPLHISDKWIVGDPRKPALGVSATAAAGYCDWLNDRFPEFYYKLPGSCDPSVVAADETNVFWLATRVLSPLASSSTVQRTINLDLDLDFRRARAEAHLLARARALDDNLIDPNARINLKLARARELARELQLDLDLARELSRDLAWGLDHALNLKSGGFSRNHALAVAIALALDCSRGLNRALDGNHNFHLVGGLDVARAHGRYLAGVVANYFSDALELKLDLPFFGNEHSGLETFEKILAQLEARITESLESVDVQRIELFLFVCPLWSPRTTVFQIKHIYQELLLECIEVIQAFSRKLITPQISKLEDLLRLIEARKNGSSIPREGIRVIRTRRR